MFGYVKIFKPELKIYEYEVYRSVYCAVCKRLGKKYGHAVRFSLSYDFAFLAVLGLAAENKCLNIKKSHCVYNPLKKCSYTECDSGVFDFTCAASVIMLYYKLTDDVRDSGFFKSMPRRIYRSLIGRKYRRAANEYPDIEAAVAEMNALQIKSEAENSTMDVSAEPSAAALGKVCSLLAKDDTQSRILYRIGYCVGKWVYLADALDDLEDDLKHGNFNPLADADTENAVGNLNVCSTEAGASFELLGKNAYAPILKNIFYLGMPAEIKRILNKKEKSH